MGLRNYKLGADRPCADQNKPHGGYRDAVCEEDVIEGVKRMNTRTRRENREKAETEKRNSISLSPALDEWLKRPMPGGDYDR